MRLNCSRIKQHQFWKEHRVLLHYIYAFSRRFYPKQLIVHSGYTFCQYLCSLRIEPTTFCAANAMLYHWATGTLKMTWSDATNRTISAVNRSSGYTINLWEKKKNTLTSIESIKIQQHTMLIYTQTYTPSLIFSQSNSVNSHTEVRSRWDVSDQSYRKITHWIVLFPLSLSVFVSDA